MKPKITFNRSADSEILPSILAKDAVQFDLKASSQGLGVAAVDEPVGLEARSCIIHPGTVACQLQSWELVHEPLQAQFPSFGGRGENPSNNVYSLMQMIACLIFSFLKPTMRPRAAYGEKTDLPWLTLACPGLQFKEVRSVTAGKAHPWDMNDRVWFILVIQFRIPAHGRRQLCSEQTFPSQLSPRSNVLTDRTRGSCFVLFSFFFFSRKF